MSEAKEKKKLFPPGSKEKLRRFVGDNLGVRMPGRRRGRKCRLKTASMTT